MIRISSVLVGVRLLRLGLAGKWNGLHQAAETNLVEAGP